MKNRPLSGPRPEIPQDAWELLQSMLTPNRRERMLQVVANRTRHFRLVIQDVHNAHNVAACIRSADAFGIQDIDVVTLQQSFKLSTVAKGTGHWLTIRKWKDVPGCAEALKTAGYKLAAGLPDQNALQLSELPVGEKIAVVFGNEHDGIDDAWKPLIDYPFTIPMVGQVESLNISVSAAITMFDLTRRARAGLSPENYLLPEAERHVLLNQWVCHQISSWPEVVRRIRAGITPAGIASILPD